MLQSWFAFVAGQVRHWKARADFAQIDPRLVQDAGLDQSSYCGPICRRPVILIEGPALSEGANAAPS